MGVFSNLKNRFGVDDESDEEYYDDEEYADYRQFEQNEYAQNVDGAQYDDQYDAEREDDTGAYGAYGSDAFDSRRNREYASEHPSLDLPYIDSPEDSRPSRNLSLPLISRADRRQSLRDKPSNSFRADTQQRTETSQANSTPFGTDVQQNISADAAYAAAQNSGAARSTTGTASYYREEPPYFTGVSVVNTEPSPEPYTPSATNASYVEERTAPERVNPSGYASWMDVPQTSAQRESEVEPYAYDEGYSSTSSSSFVAAAPASPSPSSPSAGYTYGVSDYSQSAFMGPRDAAPSSSVQYGTYSAQTYAQAPVIPNAADDFAPREERPSFVSGGFYREEPPAQTPVRTPEQEHPAAAASAQPTYVAPVYATPAPAPAPATPETYAAGPAPTPSPDTYAQPAGVNGYAAPFNPADYVTPTTPVTASAFYASDAVTRVPSSAIREIVVVTPTAFEDAELIASALSAHKVVVVNVRDIPDFLSRRVMDFAFGAASVCEASVTMIATKVYALTFGAALNEYEILSLRNRGAL